MFVNLYFFIQSIKTRALIKSKKLLNAQKVQLLVRSSFLTFINSFILPPAVGGYVVSPEYQSHEQNSQWPSVCVSRFKAFYRISRKVYLGLRLIIILHPQTAQVTAEVRMMQSVVQP